MNGVLRTALVGLVVLGCRIEFVGPEAAAQYRVVVSFSDSSAVATSIVATLRPGFTASGDQPNIPNDTISVWNSVLAPLTTDDAGQRNYETTSGEDPRTLPDAVVSTSAPPIAGLGTPADLSLHLVWRAGPHSITASRSADLSLGITNADLLSGVDGNGWTLTVRVQRGSDFPAIFRTSSVGPPPPSVTIPATVFASTGASVLYARLTAVYTTESVGGASNRPDYIARLTISAELHWTLTLVNP